MSFRTAQLSAGAAAIVLFLLALAALAAGLSVFIAAGFTLIALGLVAWVVIRRLSPAFRRAVAIEANKPPPDSPTDPAHHT